MTLYEVFNENLGRIPERAMEARKVIALLEWPDMRKKHAYTILDQLCGGCPLVKESCKSVGINLSRLTLTLSPEECGIEGVDTFNEQDIAKARQYVIELLADMNKYVKGVEFDWSYQKPKKETITFEISWIF